MRVLVTGASGFMGRGLLEFLSQRGCNGIATGRTPPPNLPHGWTAQTRRELLLSKGVEAAVDAVIHLEVKQHVLQPSPADVAAFQQVNVCGTQEWLEWAAALGVQKFVLASSIKAVQPHDGVAHETALPERIDPYGRSKAAAEAAVRGWAQTGHERSAVILRFAPVYGPGNEANLAAFARQVLRGRPCLIGDGQTRKSVVSRSNAVAAIAHAMKNIAAGAHVFNVSDPETPSLNALACMIADSCKAPKPKHVPFLMALIAAKFGDLLGRCTGMPFPMTSRRLKTLTEEGIFPVVKLSASGFVHPQTTAEGIAEMARWVAAGELSP